MKKQKFLVCPLNWGLGHATRCIPLILQLQNAGHEVVIAASGRSLALLKQRFPETECVDFPDYDIHCPTDRSLVFRLMLRFPIIQGRVRNEHKELERLIDKYHITTVISDNRYGLWSRQARSILITHQLMLKLPSYLRLWETPARRALQRYLRRFDSIWIPDLNDRFNLSGDLSHRYPLPPQARYVGIMSRFAPGLEKMSGEHPEVKSYEILALISGPEPQRSHFEELMIQQMQKSGKSCCVVRGTPEQEKLPDIPNIDFFNHADDIFLRNLIEKTQHLICRPGYSSLMDLFCLRKTALFIPTPGQSEQEYLARTLTEKKYFLSCIQSDFDLTLALSPSSEYSGFPRNPQTEDFFHLPEDF